MRIEIRRSGRALPLRICFGGTSRSNGLEPAPTVVAVDETVAAQGQIHSRMTVCLTAVAGYFITRIDVDDLGRLHLLFSLE